MADLFASTFETVDTPFGWTSETDTGNDMEVNAAAKLHGTYGLSCTIVDTTVMYVRDDTPTAETRYRARIYIDINSLAYAVDSQEVFFVRGLNSGDSGVCGLSLFHSAAAGYWIKAWARSDAAAYVYTAASVVTDDVHCVEFDWKAATGAGANNGIIELLVDGVSISTISNVDNDTKVVDYAQVGAVFIPANVTGTFYLDDFASNDDGTAIGLFEAETVAVTINGTAAIEATVKKGAVLSKWSGLGMSVYSSKDNVWALSSTFDDDLDVLIANGYTDVRIEIMAYDNASGLVITKSAIAVAVAKGMNVIWGVGSAATTITATNWAAYRTGILSAAQWAQDNGVYEFQLGNEEESHNDGTTLTDAQLRTNLLSVATEVQAIFTNGNVSYSCEISSIPAWIILGKGDLDILAFNMYREYGEHVPLAWEDSIDDMYAAFGATGTYLTEFGLSWNGLDTYSTDETVQAAAIAEMIDYIKASGITRAIYYTYYDDYRPMSQAGFGVLKTDGTYRQLWSALTRFQLVGTGAITGGDKKGGKTTMAITGTSGITMTLLSDANIRESQKAWKTCYY